MSEIMAGSAQRQLITHRAQPSDGADCNVGEVRVMPEGFPRMNVAQMHFNERNFHAQKCIPERHARVRERCRIEDDERDMRSRCLVNLIDQCGFGVALEGGQPMARFRGQLRRPLRC